MALHEKSDGIFGTNVSWRDIEEELQTELHTCAHFGPNKKATNIGDMKGFMSRVCLIEPDWQGEDIEHLPQKFIAKISSALAFMELMKAMEDNVGLKFMDDSKVHAWNQITREFHNREVAMYKTLTKANHPHIAYTKTYASKAYTEQNQTHGFIILEYKENSHTVQLYENVPLDQVDKILRSIAAITSLGESLPAEELSFLPDADFNTRMMDIFFGDSSAEQKAATVKNSLPETHKEQEEECSKVFEFYANRDVYSKFGKLEKYFKIKKSLVHADLWTSNILFERIDKDLNLRAIIDYQTVCWGNPAQDLCRFLISCTSGPDRREHTEELLEKFYGYLIEELDGREAPYTLQQLKDSYNLFFPLAAFFILPAIGNLKKQWMAASTENAEEILKASNEKTVFMAEDILRLHKDNLTQFEDFFNSDF